MLIDKYRVYLCLKFLSKILVDEKRQTNDLEHFKLFIPFLPFVFGANYYLFKKSEVINVSYNRSKCTLTESSSIDQGYLPHPSMNNNNNFNRTFLKYLINDCLSTVAEFGN